VLQMWNVRGAHAEFSAFELHQGRNGRGGCWERVVRRNRFFVLCCSAHVVGVKTETPLSVKLRMGPRSKDQTQFRLCQKFGRRAGVEPAEVDRGRKGWN